MKGLKKPSLAKHSSGLQKAGYFVTDGGHFSGPFGPIRAFESFLSAWAEIPAAHSQSNRGGMDLNSLLKRLHHDCPKYTSLRKYHRL